MIDDATCWKKSACCNDPGRRTKCKVWVWEKIVSLKYKDWSNNWQQALHWQPKILANKQPLQPWRKSKRLSWKLSTGGAVWIENLQARRPRTSACSVGCSFFPSIIAHKHSSHLVSEHEYHVSCFNLLQPLHIHCPWRASGWQTSWWHQPSVDISCTGICWHHWAVHLRFQLWYCLSSVDSRLNCYQLLHFSSHAALRESIQGLFQGWSIFYLTAQRRLEDRINDIRWH